MKQGLQTRSTIIAHSLYGYIGIYITAGNIEMRYVTLSTWRSSNEEMRQRGLQSWRIGPLVSHRVATLYSIVSVRSGIYSNEVAYLRKKLSLVKMIVLLPVEYSLHSQALVKSSQSMKRWLTSSWKAVADLIQRASAGDQFEISLPCAFGSGTMVEKLRRPRVYWQARLSPRLAWITRPQNSG